MLKEYIGKKFPVKSKQDFCFLPKFKAKEWEAFQKREEVLKQAEAVIDQPIPELTATEFMTYFKTGKREWYHPKLAERRKNLILMLVAQVLFPEKDFIPRMIDYIWAICEETSWIMPAHNNHYYTHYPDHVNLPRFDAERTYVDLMSGYTGNLLAVAYYFFEEQFAEYSPLINQRIVQRIKQRLVLPILNYDDFGWMGLSAEGRINNWNTWIVSNGLFAALCVLDDEMERRLFLNKIFLLLDQFINYHQPDGACDEGPGYFVQAGGALIRTLEMISYVTEGEVDVTEHPLIQNIGLYAIRATLFDYVVAGFGDNSSQQRMYSPLIYLMGKVLRNEQLMQFGLYRFEFDDEEMMEYIDYGNSHVQMRQLLLYPEMVKRLPSNFQFDQTCFMKDTMILTSRECPSDCMGFTIAAKGGHNDESHNHNDVGQVMVYLDKKPVMIDPGSSVYTEKTFSPQRYEIPNMQSGFHNLPNINGVMQKDGKEYCAEFVDFQDSEEQTILSYDIGKAYPEEAGVDVLKRTTLLDRKKGIVTITDDYSVRRGEITWNLMVYGEPEISGNKIKTISGCVITAEGTDTEISACYAEELDQVRVKEFWDEPIYHVTLKGTDVTVGHLTLLFEKGC